MTTPPPAPPEPPLSAPLEISFDYTRSLGPVLTEHRIGRANLVAAFPEKSAAEIDDILRGVWDNLGRVAAELAHIDRLRIKCNVDARNELVDGDDAIAVTVADALRFRRRAGKQEKYASD